MAAAHYFNNMLDPMRRYRGAETSRFPRLGGSINYGGNHLHAVQIVRHGLRAYVQGVRAAIGKGGVPLYAHLLDLHALGN